MNWTTWMAKEAVCLSLTLDGGRGHAEAINRLHREWSTHAALLQRQPRLRRRPVVPALPQHAHVRVRGLPGALPSELRALARARPERRHGTAVSIRRSVEDRDGARRQAASVQRPRCRGLEVGADRCREVARWVLRWVGFGHFVAVEAAARRSCNAMPTSTRTVRQGGSGQTEFASLPCGSWTVSGAEAVSPALSTTSVLAPSPAITKLAIVSLPGPVWTAWTWAGPRRNLERSPYE